MKKYVLAALIVMSAVLPSHAQGLKTQGPTMAIRGTGNHEVKPDYATLYLSIYDLNRSSERAMEAHAKQLAKAKELLEELKRDGVEIKKSDFQLRSQQKTETIRSSNGSTTQNPSVR